MCSLLLDARRGRAVETRILAQDFSAEGRRELEAEFGADAARSVIEDVKSGRGSADRKYFEAEAEPVPAAAAADDGDGYDE